jgi:hypothetical protein
LSTDGLAVTAASDPQAIDNAPVAVAKLVVPPITLASPQLFLVLFGAVIIGLAWIARDLVFGPAIYETGDAAVNALQIDRAKHLTEYLGNYSRFGFHHPGPAFFYAYALGELLFGGILAAPANAHILAGLILQAGFLAGSLAILATMPNVRRGPFLVVALSIAAAFFGWAGSPELSIWPPNVLIMPTVLFGCCVVGLWLGRSWLLPVLVLAGGFLVDGHVAQPLFVIPGAVLAEIGLLWTTRGRALWKPHLVAVLAAVPFLVPLLVDLSHGPDSNLALILATADVQSRSLRDSLGELSNLLVAGPRDRVLTERAQWPAALWLLAALPIAVLHRRGVAWMRPIAALLVVDAMLVVSWQVIQQGAPWDFNDYFVLGLLFLGLVPTILLLSMSRWIIPIAGAVLVLTLVLTPRPLTFVNEALGREAHAAVAAMPVPGVPVLIVFPPTGERWIEAAAVALALERRGIQFVVVPEWAFIFGADHVRQPGIDVVAWTVR